jgi:tetratricopeptide (TPR) repeat protein
MALFGFNKQKVLANAEKYVQQGKLQNAISEYEKILKNDAKDLTVTNTVGDLYSRLGEIDKATECFKTVGDAYAGQGFTVKAIAMYKKISKLKPSLESLLKLAELYTQQGLFNDARAQYLQVAEEFLKASEFENAVRIFQKILEMDPENTTMRVRLAEVYIRLGKKTDAWQIFSAVAESLRSKGSLSGAEEILQRMLALDPGNTYALLMQGKNQVESGDAASAVATLQKVSDIDSNPDGLRDLLKAYLATGQLSEAGTVASKLLTVHNDLAAISSFADALMQAGQYDTALQVYGQHSDRLLAENSEKVLEHLHSIIGHVRDNPDSLQKLLDLFQMAGETTHVSEVSELLAHASVQSGDLPRARDLYHKLAQIEPQNPLHMQNYQQVVSQLGGGTDSKLITPEEAVVLIDDLEATAPSVHQHYSDEVALSVRSALTDAELFISYNMPAKALGPLMGALPLAPNDLRINQRLAALHTRAGRFAEAGVCCRTLQTLYSEAGYPEEATRYGELSERYEERARIPAPGVPPEDQHIFLDAAAAATAHASAEIAVGEPEIEIAATEETVHEEMPVEPAQAASPWPTASAEAHGESPVHAAEEISIEPGGQPELAVAEESSASAPEVAADAAEIDLSTEWDEAITVEADAPETGVPAEPVVEASATEEVADSAVSDDENIKKAEETIEEIRFYLANGMPEQAMAGLAKLQTLTDDHEKLAELHGEIEAVSLKLAQEEGHAEVEPVVEELTADDIPSIQIPSVEVASEEEPVTAQEHAAPEAVPEVAPKPDAHKLVIHKPAAHKPAAHAPAAHKEESAVAAHAPAPEVVGAPEAEPVAEPAVAEASDASGPLKEFVADLESSLGEEFLPRTVVHAEAPAPAKTAGSEKPAAAAAHAAASASFEPSAAPLGQFVADIEASLGADFLKAAPIAEAAPTAPPAPQSAAKPQTMVASAAASAAAAPHVPAPRVSIPASTPVAETPTPRSAPPAAHPAAAPAAAAKSPFGEDAGVDLSEMFGEIKHDLEAGVTANDEDPETHYNLGIAFREMGLLDEAIGELQKTCQAHDRGHSFPQIMQTYTWLAQCFLEKGVPEAAVRWFEKALKVPGIDGETRVALDYELASAYETAGDKPAALRHFMDVYGTNIDYRDVAERIKALKS